MDLQQIRYVVAVAETASFTRAAQRCFVVQSALSHQIAALERELDVRLFARTSRRVQLTAAGAAFLPAARRCLDAAERAAADAAAAVGQVHGQVSVGVIPTVTAVDIPAGLQRLREKHPRVRIALRAGASDELAAKVRDGDLDVAVLGLPETEHPRGVRARELARDRLVAVLPAAHPLAERRQTDLAGLAEETFVDFPAGTPGRAQSDQAFAAGGLRREVAYEVMGTDLMVQIVRRGLAIALLPAAVTARLPDVAAVPIADGPGRVEYLVWSDFNPSPAALAFVDALDPR